jgi:hypothetical protein
MKKGQIPDQMGMKGLRLEISDLLFALFTFCFVLCPFMCVYFLPHEAIKSCRTRCQIASFLYHLKLTHFLDYVNMQECGLILNI